MVGEVVVDRHAPRLAAPLEAPLDASEGGERLAQRLGRRAGFGRDGERGERVADVVLARERHREAAGVPPAAEQAEARAGRPRLDVDRPPVRPGREPEGHDAAASLRQDRDERRALAARDQQAAPRNDVQQPREGRLHRREVGIDVGVVELDVAHDRDRPAGSARTSAACRRTPSRTRRPRSRTSPPRPDDSCGRSRAARRRRGTTARGRRDRAGRRAGWSWSSCRAFPPPPASGARAGTPRRRAPAGSCSAGAGRALPRPRGCRARARCRSPPGPRPAARSPRRRASASRSRAPRAASTSAGRRPGRSP